MARHIYPLGRELFDPEMGTLKFEEGVIFEENGMISTDGPRTYIGVKKSPDGSFNLTGKVALRDMSPYEIEHLKTHIRDMLRKPTLLERIRRDKKGFATKVAIFAAPVYLLGKSLYDLGEYLLKQ